MSEHRTALIVGASRGLGLGLARAFIENGWRVVATTRGRNDGGLTALAAEAGDRLKIVTFDMDEPDVIVRLGTEAGALDVLFVSAGVIDDTDKPAGEVDPREFGRVMRTNALAPMTIIERLGADVAAGGAIVAMTSVLGSVGGNTGGGYEVYRASKAALNTMLRSYAARHADRCLIAMHPGWVRTDMGGANAAIGIEESARGIVAVVTGRLGTPGCVYVDYQGATIPW